MAHPLQRFLFFFFLFPSLYCLQSRENDHQTDFFFFHGLFIDVPINHVMHADACTLIPAKIITFEGHTDAFIASGYWDQLEYSSEELALGRFNLLNHLVELIPKTDSGFAFVMAGNGIQTNAKDFDRFSLSIRDKIPDAPLFLSLYNPTEGIQKDLARAFQEFDNILNPSIVNTRQVVSCFAETLFKINPQALCLYIAHSEGCGIFSCASKGMNTEQQRIIQKNLYFLGFGPTIPVSKNDVFNAVNIYSEKDLLTLSFSKRFIDNPDFDIQVVPCLTPPSEWNLFLADHAFLGKTYQTAQNELIHELRIHYGFFSG